MRIRSLPSHAWMLVCLLVAFPVSAQTLASLNVSPAEVVGGSNASGTVTLSPRAPAGGAVVALSSSSTFAVVPPSVTVPSGASSATFTISTKVVSSDTKATISATYSGKTKTDNLTIEPVPAKLISLSLSPTLVPAGTPATGTVTLDKEPPHGGAVVRLSSDNPAVKVPPNVKVDKNTTTETFTIDTTHVATSATATISATYEGVTKTALLTVPCTLGAVPPPKDFPSTDEVWMDDAFPPLAFASDNWFLDPAQKASGNVSFATDIQSGQHELQVFAPNAGLHLRVGDRFVLYALIDPCNPPQELMVLLADDEGIWEHVSYWGANLIDLGTSRKSMGELPQTEESAVGNNGQGHGAGHGEGEERTEWVRLEIKASAVGLEGRTVIGLWIALYDGRVWLDRIGRSPTCTTPIAKAPSSFKPGDVVWLEDSIPAGGYSGAGSPWIFDTTQKASGNNSFTMAAQAGVYENFIVTPSSSVPVLSGDNIVVYTLIDPCDPPREILLQFRDTSGFVASEWDHGAYWGDNLISGIGVTSPKPMGTLPQAGKWLRLEIPASAFGVGVEGPQNLSGIHMYMYGGHVWFDRMGKSPASTPSTH